MELLKDCSGQVNSLILHTYLTRTKHTLCVLSKSACQRRRLGMVCVPCTQKWPRPCCLKLLPIWTLTYLLNIDSWPRQEQNIVIGPTGGPHDIAKPLSRMDSPDKWTCFGSQMRNNHSRRETKQTPTAPREAIDTHPKCQSLLLVCGGSQETTKCANALRLAADIWWQLVKCETSEEMWNILYTLLLMSVHPLEQTVWKRMLRSILHCSLPLLHRGQNNHRFVFTHDLQ